MCNRLSLVMLLSVVMLLGALTAPAAAQSDTCPAAVETALQTLNTVCDDLQRNQACYAANRVTAAFYEDIDPDIFSQPSDTADLTTLRTISTAVGGDNADEWGVAVMNVQAMLPNTLPGQGVIYVLVGDTTLENAVSPEDATVIGDPLPGQTTVPSNVRSGPDTNFNVVGSLGAGESVGVDARNADGSWLRLVIREDTVGWIFSDLVTVDGDVDALPVLDGQQFSPMQAFVMQTGIGRPDCTQAPSKLLVQSPQNIEIDLSVNGVDVSVASTVVFDNPDGQALRLSVLEGRATIRESGRIIPAGFSARQQQPVAGDGERTDAPPTFDDLQPIDDEQFEEYEIFDELDDELFNYEIDLDEFDEFFYDDLETFEEEYFGIADDEFFFDDEFEAEFDDYCLDFPDDPFCTGEFDLSTDFDDYCFEFPDDELCTEVGFEEEFFEDDYCLDFPDDPACSDDAFFEDDYCLEFPDDPACSDDGGFGDEDFEDDFSDEDFSDDDFDDFSDEDFSDDDFDDFSDEDF